MVVRLGFPGGELPTAIDYCRAVAFGIGFSFSVDMWRMVLFYCVAMLWGYRLKRSEQGEVPLSSRATEVQRKPSQCFCSITQNGERYSIVLFYILFFF